MKVLLINTSEKTGGAAIACNRLLDALNHNGVKAKMLVRQKQTNNINVTEASSKWLQPLRFVWERLVILMHNRMEYNGVFGVDIANTGTDITQLEEFREADVIHLHWTNQAFLSLSDLAKILHSGKKIVITMHDQWYFTGICHYSADCEKYTEQCCKCPQIKGGLTDLARRAFDRKRQIYSSARITFVGCSKWMATLAGKSALTHGHQITNIPNAINTNLFCPTDQQEARKHFGLPSDKRLLLFGAQRITDERKGFRYLAEACKLLKESGKELADSIAIVVVGGDSEKVKDILPMDVFTVAYIKEVRQMAELYNAVDAYVTPSLQDNLPNTIVEAMSCGVPCVGFCVGGIPEMIDHKQNGYVAKYTDATDFADGIAWVLDRERHATLASNARSAAVSTYSEQSVARKYIQIYDNSRLSNL